MERRRLTTIRQRVIEQALELDQAIISLRAVTNWDEETAMTQAQLLAAAWPMTLTEAAMTLAQEIAEGRADA